MHYTHLLYLNICIILYRIFPWTARHRGLSIYLSISLSLSSALASTLDRGGPYTLFISECTYDLYLSITL